MAASDSAWRQRAQRMRYKPRYPRPRASLVAAVVLRARRTWMDSSRLRPAALAAVVSEVWSASINNSCTTI